MYFRLAAALPKLLDVDRVLACFVTAPRTATPRTARAAVSALLGLRHTLGLCPLIAGALDGARHGLLAAIRGNLRHPRLAELQR